MVDFNKHVYNSIKFSPAAEFYKKHKCYTLAPRGTTDYNTYWEQETERCLNGYTAPDGDYITGYHYFYLNYSPIMRIDQTEYVDRNGDLRIRRERILNFPTFWDYDYYYFNAIDEAVASGKHMAVLKSRARGYSFKGASMLVRNYELIPGSKNFAVASELKFLIGDGLLTKAWQIMDFIDKNTAWAKQRLVSTRMERVAGYKVTDEFGKQTEQGYMSSITGITLKNDPERIRGTRAKLVLWEEGGKFPNLLDAWRIELPSVELDDGFAFGLQIAFGTGGTQGASFTGLKELFYKPEAYNVLSFPNIWDDNAEQTKCGFFVPSWSNLESYDADGNPQYMDKDGNSLKEKAIGNLIELRNKIKDGGASQLSIDRFISERPIKPREAVLELGKNIFPRKLLLDQLTRIRTNTKLRNMKHIVDLNWDGNGSIIATEKKSGDITEYPLKKGDKPTGSIVIWEYPVKDAPFGLYVGGCLTPGEKVVTQRGLVNVEDVTLDDNLVNKDGKFVAIKNIQIRNKVNEPIYTIKPTGSYRTTTFTSKHPIWTANRGFVNAEDLTRDDVLEIPNMCDSNELPNEEIVDTNKESLAYFYGLYTGDGFLNKNKNSHDIYMSIGKSEKEFADYYDRFIKDRFSRDCVHIHKNTELSRRFTHKVLYEMLMREVGNSAYTKRIPNWIKFGSSRIKRAFVHGYLDTDGSVFNDRNNIRVNFTSVNLALLEDLLDILFGLHIPCSIVIHQKENVNKYGGISKQSYRLNIPIKYSHNIGCCCGTYFFGRKERILAKTHVMLNKSKLNIQFPLIKYSEYQQYTKFVLLGIDDIKQSSYTGIVYNFECDTHTFMSRNVVTHNCDPLKSAGYN